MGFWGGGGECRFLLKDRAPARSAEPAAPTCLQASPNLGICARICARARPRSFGPAGRRSPGSSDWLRRKRAAASAVSVSVSSGCRRRPGSRAPRAGIPGPSREISDWDCYNESAEANPQRLLEANHWTTSGGKTKFWSGLSRGPGLPGWLHEYRLGADGGVCKRTAEEQVWGRVYPRKQCVVHKHTEEKDVTASSAQ